MDRRFLTILAILVIIFGGIFVASQNSSSKSSGGKSSSNGQPTNHVEGQNAKNVTFVEYGDYQCPICGAYYQPVKDALTPDILQNIHFQFRNLPLSSIHQNAYAGARAAEAAGLQNKYWEMHDKLYENQQAWSSSNDPITIFTGYAKDIGLSTSQFKTDYLSDKVNNAINADLAEFKKTGKEQATPTFFLNGKYVANSEFSDPSTGAPSAEKLKQIINNEIAKKTSSTKQ
jgi:protein-disulfide isomerase